MTSLYALVSSSPRDGAPRNRLFHSQTFGSLKTVDGPLHAMSRLWQSTSASSRRLKSALGGLKILSYKYKVSKSFTASCIYAVS